MRALIAGPAFALLALAAAAAPADQAVEPGVRLTAIGSAEIVLAAGADRAIRPAADVEVDGPLAVGATAPLRVFARLRLLGLPGEDVDLGSVDTVRATEVSFGAYKRVGRVELGGQEIWTSVETEWGFATALPGPETSTADRRHPRHYGIGFRLEERHGGAWVSLLYGRHESAGVRGFGQWLVSGAVPMAIAKGAIVLGGDAILSAGPDAGGLQRDQVRVYVGVDVPQLVGALR